MSTTTGRWRDVGYGYLLPGGVPDDDEEEDAKAMPGDEVRCNRCGEGPFTWTHTGVRWRLVGERGKLHECHGAPGSADDFD